MYRCRETVAHSTFSPKIEWLNAAAGVVGNTALVCMTIYVQVWGNGCTLYLLTQHWVQLLEWWATLHYYACMAVLCEGVGKWLHTLVSHPTFIFQRENSNKQQLQRLRLRRTKCAKDGPWVILPLHLPSSPPPPPSSNAYHHVRACVHGYVRARVCVCVRARACVRGIRYIEIVRGIRLYWDLICTFLLIL